jgi:hypothetical protein
MKNILYGSIVVAATQFLSTTFWLMVRLQHEHAATVTTTAMDGAWSGIVLSDEAILVIPAQTTTADHPPPNKPSSRSYFFLHVGPQKTLTLAL